MLGYRQFFEDWLAVAEGRRNPKGRTYTLLRNVCGLSSDRRKAKSPLAIRQGFPRAKGGAYGDIPFHGRDLE